jgi:hypothetical protein
MRRQLIAILAALVIVASAGVPASGSQDRASVVSSSKLTNKDVLQMQSGGLSGEIIIEKICLFVESITCVFSMGRHGSNPTLAAIRSFLHLIAVT